MTISQAPIADKLLDDNGKARPAWVEFFSELNRGDVGTSFTPSITGLTEVGAATISGVYYQNSGFADWAVKIVPGTNTSSTFGATFIALPFNVTADVPCFAAGTSGASLGVITAASKQAFLPTWTTITTPITITGRVKN